MSLPGGYAIRGSRVGSGPSGEQVRGDMAPRIEVSYWCALGHESRPAFATDDDVEAPELWDCFRCGNPAGQDRTNPPDVEEVTPYKTHLAYVKERRTDQDGAALLDEALATLRARRTRRADQA